MIQYITISKNTALLFKASKSPTAAGKQRRYHQRRDSHQEKRAEFLSKCRQKYQLDKQLGKRKSIQEMTVWRQPQQDHRYKK
jgi:hypothetical protein